MVFTRPLVSNFSTLITGGGDAWHTLWTLWHAKEALLGRAAFFSADLLYFPQGITLLGHSLGPLLGVLTAPLWVWGPEVVWNGATLLSFVLTGYGLYLLARTMGFTPLVAFFAGSFYLAAPIHLTATYGHLSKAFLGLLPLALLAFHRALRPQSSQSVGHWKWQFEGQLWPLLTALCLLGALLHSAEQFVYAGLALLFFALAELWACPVTARRALMMRLLCIALWSLLCCGPLLVQIQRATHVAGITVNVNLESRQHQPDLLNFFVPFGFGQPLFSPRLRAFTVPFTKSPIETAVFLTYTGMFLALLAGWKGGSLARRWLLFTACYMLFALGPNLVIAGQEYFTEYKLPILLPYALLTALPSFDYMRTPARFMLIGFVGMSMSVAYGLAWLQRHIPARLVALLPLVVTGLILLENWPQPFPQQSLRPVPAFYQQIANDPEQYGVFDLPVRPTQKIEFGSWFIYNSSNYQLYQMTHGKGIASGYVSRFYDVHPLFAQFISENFTSDSPLQQDVLINGQPANRFANARYELVRNHFRYLVLHKPRPEYDNFHPGDWGEQAARFYVKEILGAQPPLLDDELTTVYAITDTLDIAELTPNIALLDRVRWLPEWQPEHRWVQTPASFVVMLPKPQLAYLGITAAQLYHPEMDTHYAQAKLTLTSGEGRVQATGDLLVDEPLVLPVALVAGTQHITMTLQTTITGLIFQRVLDLNFANQSINLVTQGDESPLGTVNNLLVNPPVQDNASLQAWFGPGWYPAEGDGQSTWRWATTPSELWVYSTSEQAARIEATPVALHLPEGANGKGEQGSLTITVNQQPGPLIPVQVGQPFVVELTLHQGWNSMAFALASGNFRPVDVEPASGDTRLLSFALSKINVLTR